MSALRRVARGYRGEGHGGATDHRGGGLCGWGGAAAELRKIDPDGLGLAETTPGPLILVTEFVGFLGAYRHGGEPALAYGLLGAAVTLWATPVLAGGQV